jgi:O-antigen ligase
MKSFIEKLALYLQYLNLYSLLALLAALPFQYEYRKIPGIIFLVTFILEYAVSRRWRNMKFTRARWYFTGMIFFFTLMFIYLPIENDLRLWHRLLDWRLSLAGFGVMGFLGLSPRIKLRYVLNTFIITAVIITFYLIFYRTGLAAWLQNPIVEDSVRVDYVNVHPLFNFYFNIALAGVWYMLYSKWRSMRNAVKALYFAAALPLYYMLLTSCGRTGVFTTITITMLFAAISLWKYRRWLGILVLVVSPFVIKGGMAINKRFSTASDDPRWFLWKIAVPLIKDKPLLGYGAANAQNNFDRIRKNHPDNLTWLWSDNDFVDAHNQYVISALEFGALGLLLLMFLYLAPLFLADKKMRPLLIVFTMMVLIESCTDSVIHRQHLGGIFCLLMVIIFAQKYVKD